MKPLPAADLDHVLAHVQWDELRGQRIFITGGTGFFGKWLLETFAHANRALALGAQAVMLSRRPQPARDAICFVEGDVRTFVFPRGEFSHVIHAAATSSAPVPPLEMLDTIIGGTRRALDFAAACGAKKFLFTSSGAVYGRLPPDMSHIPETYAGAPDPADPSSAYGEGKRVGELLCRLSGLDAKIARCFAFAGPHLPLNAHFAIGNFIRDALAGGPIKVSGDGTPTRSYLYAADLAIWLWTILFKGETCRAYNVGSDEPISIANLAHEVSGFARCDVEIAKAPSGGPALRYVPDTARARGELGLRERIPLAETLRRTFEWQRCS